MSNPQMTPVQLARQKLDEEIGRILSSPVRVLRTRRNALAPIHVLPIEVISEIFAYARLDWRSITSVCSHWRAVSLQCPTIWSHLVDPYHHPEWIALLLERSRSAPLRLMLDPGVSSIPESLNLVLKHASQFEVLRLHGDEAFMRSCMQRIEGPMPLLNRLFISSEYAAPSFIVPDSFCSSTPRLRHLILIHYNVRWDRPIFHGLVYLSILSLPWQSDVPRLPLSTSQLLRILGASPALQSLSLTDAVQDVHGPDLVAVSDSVQVSLCQLRSLELQSDLSASTFLQHIQFPASATFNVYWDVRAADSDDSIGAALSAFKGTGVDFTHKLTINPESGTGMVIKCEKRSHCRATLIVALDLELSFPFSWIPGRLLSILFSRLSLSHLHELTIWGDVDFTKEEWAQWLAPLSRLQTLEVQGYNEWIGYPILFALTATADSVNVPSLETLTLVDIDFDKDSETQLRRCLESRHAQHVEGMRLNLNFTGCTYNDGADMYPRDMVQDVLRRWARICIEGESDYGSDSDGRDD
ncbi:hypothetical protein PLICRDRAFT_697902 [Plicaturopsis crispa FD-325 SS-3]|nr:hypothetical protein PLICRDRAFT_697902 [Plicaturopsis crispa FD-325 SS-3]